MRKLGKVIMPSGINYMIQEYHYSANDAKEYVDMLIDKMTYAIMIKEKGGRIAPLMTLEHMKLQLEVMRQFKVIEVDESEVT